MKYIKKFENTSKLKKGDIVLWISDIEDIGYHSAPISRSVKYGDECEITDIKNSKGETYVKLKNLKTNKPVNKSYNKIGNAMLLSRDGHWLSSDNIQKKDNIKYDENNYKKYIILNFKKQNNFTLLEILNKVLYQYNAYIIKIFDNDIYRNSVGRYNISHETIEKNIVYQTDSLSDALEKFEIYIPLSKYNI
jgi:hypothetical protein